MNGQPFIFLFLKYFKSIIVYIKTKDLKLKK
jgi:hypothetical protein